jgi:hypothetical protein
MAGLNLFTNNAGTTLATGINSSVTSLTVASATGGLFPNPTAGQYFYCTLSNAAGTTIEIVKVTARSTDTFTIVRGQDGTSAAAFIAGDKVELRLTAADLQNFPQLDSTNTFSQTQTFSAGITSTATPIGVTSGGTGAASLAAASIATLGYTTTATAAGTTTLTASSTATQFFTGTTTQTVVLPVTSTLTVGQQFTIHNNSTGAVTINSSGSNLVATADANTTTILTCILTSGTTAASWDADFTGFTTSLPASRGGTGLTAPGTAGNVLTSNGTAWTSATPSSGTVSKVVQSFPLKATKSVTLGILASINASGEVGDLPTLNTLGTARANSTTTAYNAISNDGSRAVRVTQTNTGANATWTINGVAITSGAIPTNGGTTVTMAAIFNGGGYTVENPNSNVYIYPIGNSTFFAVTYGSCVFTSDSDQNYPGNITVAGAVITVDASGNCTKGTQVTYSNSATGLPFQQGIQYIGKVTNSIFPIQTTSNYGYPNTYYTANISGTTVTFTSDAEATSWVGANGTNSTITSSNILVWGIGTTVRTASYSAGNIGAYTDTTVITDNNSGVTWWNGFDANTMLAYYQDTSLNNKYRMFSVNQTTGALTSVGTFTTTLTAQRLNSIKFKSATEAAGTFYAGGYNYVNTMALASNIPTGFNVGTQISTQAITGPYYNATDTNWRIFYTPSSYPTNNLVTVNAYSTDPFNLIGIPTATSSSSPVSIAVAGVQGGFTGLTPGSLYYASTNNDGTVSTSSSSGQLVGKATSTTEILLNRGS